MDDVEPPLEPQGLTPIKTYSLEEVAAMVLPSEWKDGVRWLSRKLKAGDISGYELGRGKWRMTHADVEDLIERHRNSVRPWSRRIVDAEPEPETDAPVINGKPYGGLTRRSWLYHTRANTPGTRRNP